MGARPRILLVSLALALLAGCNPAVDKAREQEAYFLWAGVSPPAWLERADVVYVLSGEVRASDPRRFVSLRSQPPRVNGPRIWLVVRTETLGWDEQVYERILRDLALWDEGVELVGLQLDFDAATRGLDGYAEFLRDLRARLPSQYRLSITGLLDWSANGDPAALAELADTVDEVVIQTYQARNTIPGYEAYTKRLDTLPFDYRIAIVEDGGWQEPPHLAADPHYRGTVIFLLPD